MLLLFFLGWNDLRLPQVKSSSMSEKKNVCVICSEGATSTKKLINNPGMIDELLKCCYERQSLGQCDTKQLTDYLGSLSESGLKALYYHSECRKPIVNKSMIERLRAKRERSDSPAYSVRGRGRPSTESDSARPKRRKSVPKEEVCLFAGCSFCPNDSSEPLHQVLTDKMGENLLLIKQKTQDDCVRTCVAGLQSAGDASAWELYYHNKCLRSAQRTFHPMNCSNEQLIRSVCDEQLLLSVQNTLSNDDTSLSMADVNSEYLVILKRYQVEINESGNFRKHLRKLITERLPNIQIVKSLRKNEPDKLVLPSAVSKAIELRSALLDNDNKIGALKNVASVLREEILQYRKWSFTGSFQDFDNPALLQFFITQVLFGSQVLKVSQVRNEEVEKAVDVTCQFLVQNTRSDRQVQHQPKTHDGFRQVVQTPLSIGLPLAIHSRVRDKNLVNTLSEVYIGSDYKRILDLEKRVEQGILQRMNDTGGFCLPDFVKKGVNIWFAVDNIDLLEDTPTGQNTFHGTVVVINQQAVDGEPVNQPLIIPEKLTSPAPVAFQVRYLQDEVIKTRPIRFQAFELGKRKSLVSNDFTHTWALANFLATDDTETPVDQHVVNDEQPVENEMQPVLHDEQQESEGHYAQHADDAILSVKTQVRTGKKLAKEGVMPTWAATKSLLLSQSGDSRGRTNTEVIAPLFKTSPTDYVTLHTVLMLTQGISAFVVGPERKTLITLDLDLYSRAIQIQQSVGNNNWILRAGILHIVFAALHALGKTVDGSGIDMCAIESGTYTSAALRGIYGGKAYKRGIEYHITTSLAIMMMRYDAIFTSHPPEALRDQCTALRNALHDRSPDMSDIYDDILSMYSGNVKPHEEAGEDTPELAEFLTQYLEQVESLLCLASACRSRDWEGYLAALENLIRYFFARDLLNYARLMPIHLAQMNALEHDDPATWDALKSGDFVVSKSEVPFTHLFTDQALEQEIKELKGHGGIVGLSQEEAALDRLVTTTPHLARIVKQYLHSFPHASTSERNEHYQLAGDIAIRSRENALKLRHSIELHCGGNPFTLISPLKSLVSSALIPSSAKDDILHFAEKGQTRFEEFIRDRLLPTSTLSVWDSQKKLKLKTFSNWMEKTKVRVGDKVIKLREERQLLGRFLIIQGSRPELVPKLEETIGTYEMSVVPRSLCAVDGSLYIPTDKANLMHAIEAAKAQPLQAARLGTVNPVHRALVVDAMAVLQSMKKTPSIRKVSDLMEAFIKRIEWMMVGYQECRVIFDRYIQGSLKSKTRRKREVTSTEYEVHPEMRLTMSLKELLSATRSKGLLSSMLAEGLLKHFSGNRDVKLIVVYDTKIKGDNYEEYHTHEEADTLIPLQVLASMAESAPQEVCVWSPDTDVLILLLHLAACGHLGADTGLKFLTGKGTKYRQIDVVERVQVIGRHKCQGLIGFHNFSGADWGGKFVGISKKTWVDAYMKLQRDDPIINCFRELGDGPIPTQLVNDELPQQVKELEHFVCRVYCSTGPIALPALRWELFRSKNLEGEMLPPTRSALLPHILRANYIAMRDKSYLVNCPVLPPIEQNGWIAEEGNYNPVHCLTFPAPRAVIELTKCGCKAGCKGRCTCHRNNLPCTPLCKCSTGDCGNGIQIPVQDDMDDD